MTGPTTRTTPGEAEEDEQPLVVTNSADFGEGAIAPLEIISIFGLGIGPEDLFGPEFDENGDLRDYVRPTYRF